VPLPLRAARRRPRRVASIAVALALIGALTSAVTAAPDGSARRTAGNAAPAATRTEFARVPAAYNPSNLTLRLVRVMSGFSKPVYVTHAGDGSGRLFVVEQPGRIRVYKNGAVLSTPMLDLTAHTSKGSEQGLLGLAFHPGFKTNKKLYVNLTLANGDTAINEYRVGSNPDRVDTSTGRRLLTIPQPYSNHNGGHMAFGPDGYLYIGMGDGGDGGDPGNRAQNTKTLLGKMLRIDVNGTSSTKPYRVPSSNPYVGKDGWDEIWSLGLRNPWRWSFDRATGYMWVADVGQVRYEEINRATNSPSGRGTNYGWRRMEGRHCYSPPSGCNTNGLHWPIAEYPHAVSGADNCSVTGGYVYRGPAYPDLQGGYLFADFCSGRIWGISATAGAPVSETLLYDSPLMISSFGENQSGELYVTDHAGGGVYRVIDAG
jgi:glucose/arabinose dehydrogenase